MKITHKTFDISYTPEEKAIIYEQLFWFNISITAQLHYADSLIKAKKLKKELIEKEENTDLIIRESNFFLFIIFLFLSINFFIFVK